MTLTLPDTRDISNWNWEFAELFPWTLNFQASWNIIWDEVLCRISFKLQINISIFCKKHSVKDKNFHLNSVWLNQDMNILL